MHVSYGLKGVFNRRTDIILEKIESKATTLQHLWKYSTHDIDYYITLPFTTGNERIWYLSDISFCDEIYHINVQCTDYNGGDEPDIFNFDNDTFTNEVKELYHYNNLEMNPNRDRYVLSPDDISVQDEYISDMIKASFIPTKRISYI